MVARVCLQMGHNGDGGGAPGEMDWNRRLTDSLAARLREAGVRVTVVGGWYGGAPPPEVEADADLFWSTHFDGATYAGRDRLGNTGCFADRAEADPVGELSDLAIRHWEAVYPREAGGDCTPIPIARWRRNANTFRYYAFNATSPRTPGVICEHGCGAPVGTGGFPPGLDSHYLHTQIEHVAALDARAILAFLRETGALPQQEDGMVAQGIVDELTRQVEALRQEVAGLNSQVGYYQHDVEAPLRQEVAALKTGLAQAEAHLAATIRSLDAQTAVNGDLAARLAEAEARPPGNRPVGRIEAVYEDGQVARFVPAAL